LICNPNGHQGWEILTQRNHALLAAELLAPWPPERRPQPWFQLLNACAQHDHGWLESELDCLVDETGRPIDFLHMTIEASLGVSRRSLQHAEAQSRWCAILVARHLEYLFSAKDDPATLACAAETRSRRQAYMEELGVSRQHVEEMYELLCWADSLSLVLCCQDLEFTRMLSLQAQGRDFTVHQLGRDRWSLSPWPYPEARLRLQYEVRVLPQSRFADAKALRQALRQASVEVRTLERSP
jgi:hypothetical protein